VPLSDFIVSIFFKPFLAGLLFTSIFTYFGLLILRRNVIFVDLAMGQVAALGSTVAFIMGFHPDTMVAYLLSLMFTIMAAIIFSFIRVKNRNIPQEAFVGLIYAMAVAAVILLASQGPHGASHIKSVMTGDLLWIKWDSIIIMFGVYCAIGLVHYIFKDIIVLISENPDKALTQGINVKLWDFFFYLTLGIVVSVSVKTAGVLLVFIFLISPAIIAMLVSSRLLIQLIIGWTTGILVCMCGVSFSIITDLPSVSSMVVFYGLALLFSAISLKVWRSENRKKVALNMLFYALLVVVVILLIVASGYLMQNSFLSQIMC